MAETILFEIGCKIISILARSVASKKNLYVLLQFDQLGQKLLKAIAVFFDIESDYFEKQQILAQHNARNSLSSVKTEDKSERAGAHEDINYHTAYWWPSNRVRAAHQKNTWEKWSVDVVICNIGDMLQRLTNHVLPSTTHRVTAKRRIQDRFSIHFCASQSRLVYPNAQ